MDFSERKPPLANRTSHARTRKRLTQSKLAIPIDASPSHRTRTLLPPASACGLPRPRLPSKAKRARKLHARTATPQAHRPRPTKLPLKPHPQGAFHRKEPSPRAPLPPANSTHRKPARLKACRFPQTVRANRAKSCRLRPGLAEGSTPSETAPKKKE